MPHGHWKTLTLVAALRFNGLTAPYVIDGAMDGPSFLAYVEQILAPTQRCDVSPSSRNGGRGISMSEPSES